MVANVVATSVAIIPGVFIPVASQAHEAQSAVDRETAE